FAEVTTEIIKTSDGSVVTNTSVIPGTVIHDEATVTSAAVGITNDPGFGGTGNCTTGTRDCKVVFTLYKNTTDINGNPVGCTGTPVRTPDSALCVSNGPGSGSCTAESADFTTV